MISTRPRQSLGTEKTARLEVNTGPRWTDVHESNVVSVGVVELGAVSTPANGAAAARRHLDGRREVREWSHARLIAAGRVRFVREPPPIG